MFHMNPRICSKLAALLVSAGAALAQDTSFVFQGTLTDGGVPATGNYDLRFFLYDSATGGRTLGNYLCANDVTVQDGFFSVQLDFGPQFQGTDRYLEIQARSDAGGQLTCSTASGFETLPNRMRINSTMYVLNAQVANNAATAQTVPATQQLGSHQVNEFGNGAFLTGKLADKTVSGTFAQPVKFGGSTVLVGNGSALVNVNATTVATATNALNLSNQPADYYTNASNLDSNSLPNAVLSSTYNQPLKFDNSSNTYTGFAYQLTHISASQFTSGTVPPTGLAGTYPLLCKFTNPGNTFSGSFHGNGSGLTGLSASAITTGTLPTSVLPAVPIEKLPAGPVIASVRVPSTQIQNITNETLAVPNATFTITLPVVSTVAIRGAFSCYANQAASYLLSGFSYSGNNKTYQLGDGARFFFNQTGVHQSIQKNWPAVTLDPGTYTFFLFTDVAGNISFDKNDSCTITAIAWPL